ncbi:hypothetical protein K1W69_04560 [Hoeflea sp. WL0058]|uniref:Uncharacterized protein n=1 Tax=Flavimaribacter sediminis TaxID=2865987 RepID=A0AAE2ZH09_9HYPH|nr:hypothetical protein [Flavimaribacter sediminis]MBW8636453.1 hypothetical protein [Flavimaribacter sediminis]
MFYRSVIAAGAFAIGLTGSTIAMASDSAFFQSVAGKWRGPGEIVAGKYKGTKFVCDFEGGPSETAKVGLLLDGKCRVGMFTQKMSASINSDRGRYSGSFMDGGDGKGLDIVSGKISGNKIVVGLNRAKLDGAMVAHLTDQNQMNVTVSVEVQGTLVPVIGITLSRNSKVGSLRMDRR